MAEIHTVPPRTRRREMARAPLQSNLSPGGNLYHRFDLPRYQPPAPPRARQVELPVAASGVAQSAARKPSKVTLGRLLAQTADLPTLGAVLGISEDQLPVVLDLNDPTPGGVLLLSDERPQQIEMLRTALLSLVRRNSPRNVQFVIFSHLPGAWRSWVADQNLDRYSLAVLGTDESDAAVWLARAAEMSDQRGSGRQSGPAIVLVFDTLNFLNNHLDEAQTAEFEQLICEGASQKVWSIAAISTALATSLGTRLQMFRTILYGYTANAGFYTRMTRMQADEAQVFLQPGQFAIATGETSWLKFQLPAI